MFKLAPNFFSVVCVGNFNPGILSIDFIRDKCNYLFEGNPKEEPTPVISKISDDKITILVEFQRLQIVRQDHDVDKALTTIRLARDYLRVLEFTPIFKLGINFNYSVLSYEQERINLDFYNHMRDVGLALSEEAVLASTMAYSHEPAIRLCGLELRIRVMDKFNCRISLDDQQTHLTLNANFEVESLAQNREKIDDLITFFDEIVAQRDEILRRGLEQYA